LLDAFLIPDIKIAQGLPTFQLIDFLMPLILYSLLPKLHDLRKYWWTAYTLLFSVYILIPIFLNHEVNRLNDYFELYRVIKLGVVFLLFTQCKLKEFDGIIKACFLVLIGVNLLHFYNIFHINSILSWAYGDNIHFQFFGKNSLGEPAVKRMLGTMANPNTNALLFLFFSTYFFTKTSENNSWSYFFMALFMVFLCQSRTSLISVGLLLVVLIVQGYSLGIFKIFWRLVVAIGLYVFATALATSFFRYSPYSMSLLDGSALHSVSLRSRWESWEIIWRMIQEKPIFGYGPYKSYFTSMKLYAENEYLLMWWRYGVIGLIFYLGLYLIPFWEMIRRKVTYSMLRAILFIGVMVITALTNNPLNERSICLLFIYLLATGLQNSAQHEETPAYR